MKLYVACLLVLVASTAAAQKPGVYNINKYNGLSSNHVYCTLVDRMGYLWLGTTDGVYRYNGYSLRKYDYTDGLPNVDVWNLYEDKQGRIWLRSIAQHLGYIKNNKYHRVYKNTENPELEIYPGQFTESGNRIIFFNNTINQKRTFVYCFVENDTLKSKTFSIGDYSYTPQIMGDYVYHTSGSFLFRWHLDTLLTKRADDYGEPESKVFAYNITDALFKKRTIHFYDKFTIYYQPSGNTINITNVITGVSREYDVRALLNSDLEKLNDAYSYKNFVFFITNRYVIELDSNLNISSIYSVDELFDKAGANANPTYFTKADMWGEVLASSNDGILIKYNTADNMRISSSKLDKFIFLNNKNNNEGYWWNSSDNMLAIVSKGEIISATKLQGIYNPKKIVRYDSDYEIIVCANNIHWLRDTKTIIPINYGIDTSIDLDSIKYSIPVQHGPFINSNDMFVAKNKDIYNIGTATTGVKKISIDRSNRNFRYNTLSNQRFRNIVYSSADNLIVCYSTDKVFLYNPSSRYSIKLNQFQLEQLGINAVEKIAVDSFGNVFIKDYNSLKVYNYKKQTVRTLLKTYNLKQARVEIINNKLFVAGGFGALKANIEPSGNISISNIFQNTKNIYYMYIHDVQFASDNILLKTDKGSYIYKFDGNNNHVVYNYKFVVNINDSLHSLLDNNTLTIEQNAAVIDIDVIRPTGTGNLRIEYSLNNAPYKYSENQVFLPALKPGSYNTFTVIASDDSWRSEPLKFTVFIQPKWWQTNTAKQVIVIISVLVLIGFIYLIIITTRRIVNSNNERRNQRRELELKSIYSQINPHFIFNSLSTAQYFVKKNKTKEAFEHINQFSDLLRAYIKSSRAKYISIAEEIENLENYLELQLTRFEEKFNYNITVDISVNPHKVRIPSLLLQPIVENALNHGIFHSETKGNLNISFKIDESNQETLICSVDDNGIGRQKSKELRGKIIRKADSYGTILINELINTFNKYEKININIEYIDKQLPLTGTTVIIRIKNFTHAQ